MVARVSAFAIDRSRQPPVARTAAPQLLSAAERAVVAARRDAARRQTLDSLMHQADLATRQAMARLMAQLNSGGSSKPMTKKEKKRRGQELSKLRRDMLDEFRRGRAAVTAATGTTGIRSGSPSSPATEAAAAAATEAAAAAAAAAAALVSDLAERFTGRALSLCE